MILRLTFHARGKKAMSHIENHFMEDSKSIIIHFDSEKYPCGGNGQSSKDSQCQKYCEDLINRVPVEKVKELYQFSIQQTEDDLPGRSLLPYCTLGNETIWNCFKPIISDQGVCYKLDLGATSDHQYIHT